MVGLEFCNMGKNCCRGNLGFVSVYPSESIL